MVNGYFGGDVPEAFWRLLLLYIAGNTLSSVPWAIPFGQSEIDVMLRQGREVFSWYDNLRRAEPSWYIGKLYLQTLDGIPFKLTRAFDFAFLRAYGRVFAIFDDQDSGNICFGVEHEGERLFVKFAGAPTDRCPGSPREAVANLRAAPPLYQALAHDALVRFVRAEEVGGGFAMLFDWCPGVGVGRMYPASHKRFMALDAGERLSAFHQVLAFFEHVALRGYVAIDIYDGSLLYDFETRRVTICDIDCFRRSPCVNDRGRMPGSSRFMSPEEFTLGAPLDEITNVYTLGAMAFALLSAFDRSRGAWPLGDALYAVARRAVSSSRADRHPSVACFASDWRSAAAAI